MSLVYILNQNSSFSFLGLNAAKILLKTPLKSDISSLGNNLTYNCTCKNKVVY